MKFRVNGIYCLPNDRELVVTGEELVGGSQVYHLAAVESVDSSSYTVNQNGSVASDGKLTAWTIKDFRDTGRNTFSKPVHV